VKQTSVDAYHKEHSRIESQVQMVKAVFQRYSPQRLCDADVAAITGLPGNVVWSRRARLVRDGCVVEAGLVVNRVSGHRVTAYKWSGKE
jgi:hypothetical protein